MKLKNTFSVWNRTVYEIEQLKKRKEHGKLTSIFKALSYADTKDKLILAFCIFCAISVGIFAPLSVYLFLSPIVGTFIKAEMTGNPYNVTMSVLVPQLHFSGYGFVTIGTLNIVMILLQVMGSELASRNIMAKIKTAYLSKMLSLEVGWYDKSQEQFVNTVSHDLQKMLVLFNIEMTNAVEMVSYFVFGCTAGLLVSWKVALLTLALMLIATLVMFFILRTARKRGKSQQEYIRLCTKITSETLGNIRTVAAYSGEYKEIKRYKETLHMANKHGLKHVTVIALGKSLGYFQVCLCTAAAYYFAVMLYITGDFGDPGYLIVILSAQINALHRSSFMLNAFSDLNMAADSAHRVMNFLCSETSYGKSDEQGIEPDTFEPKVLFKNVQFFYPSNLHTKVLNDLTLDVQPGKVTAVVGASGAGKSTIVSLISRLYNVTSGQILIGGVDIKKLNVCWLRNQIAVVGQEPMLFDTSIEENIRYGKPTASLDEIIEAAKISYAHNFIEKLPSGYDSIVGESGTKLSVGQKQRIAIARAIVRNPKLLLLDEATSALDFHSEGIVKEAIENAMRDRTTLIISHRMSTVRKADVIYVLYEGHVTEKGTHSELMELKGYYYSLVTVQDQEEKDRVPIINKGHDFKEESIEEMKPLVQDDLEVPQNKIQLKMSRENLKVIVVWLLVVLFSVVSAAYYPAFFYLYSLICESFTFSNDKLSRIAVIDVWYIFGLGVVTSVSVILYALLSTVATQIWMEKLQKKVFNKIVSMDISWFDWSGNSPYECLEILTNSPPLIESVTGERAAQVVIFFLTLFFTFGYSFSFSLTITMINIPIFIIFIIIVYMRIKSRDSAVQTAQLTTRSTKVATEYVQNVKTIQILNCQKYIINQYQCMLLRAKKEATLGIFWNAALISFTKSMVRWSMSAIFILGVNIVAGGSIKGTTLIGVIIALNMASTLAGPALMLTSRYPAARQAYNRLHRIASSKTFLNTLTDQGIKPKISGNIIFQDVFFSYPTREEVLVLKKINLEIEAGKTVALVGCSGCGKSTIISLLERFYLPNEGKILVDGYDINDINVKYLRSQMGLVPQEPVLFDMTIKENILYGLDEDVTMDMIIEAAKIANIHNFIMKLPHAYDTPVGERGSKLSGGQKQRIAIARAALRNPKVLLLDEATSALDSENEKAVQEALENASIGRTCIVIAHRLSTIRNADKIVVLDSGTVAEEGTHEELIERRGQYFNLLHR